MELTIKTKRELHIYKLTRKVELFKYLPLAIYAISALTCLNLINNIWILFISLSISWTITAMKIKSYKKKLKRLKLISLALALRNVKEGTSDYFVIKQLLKDEK